MGIRNLIDFNVESTFKTKECWWMPKVENFRIQIPLWCVVVFSFLSFFLFFLLFFSQNHIIVEVLTGKDLRRTTNPTSCLMQDCEQHEIRSAVVFWMDLEIPQVWRCHSYSAWPDPALLSQEVSIKSDHFPAGSTNKSLAPQFYNFLSREPLGQGWATLRGWSSNPTSSAHGRGGWGTSIQALISPRRGVGLAERGLLLVNPCWLKDLTCPP